MSLFLHYVVEGVKVLERLDLCINLWITNAEVGNNVQAFKKHQKNVKKES